MKPMDREEKIEKLLETKAFAELTEEERSLVLKELGSEEQYAAMRRVTLALITSKADLSPDPEILHSLQRKMTSTSKRFSLSDIFTFRIPGYASILLIGVTALSTWFFSHEKTFDAPRIVEVLQRDTVFVDRVRTDTIYRTRVIYREARSDHSADKNYFQVVKKEGDTSEPKELGVSMKDKQELETLLVSGSE